MHLFFEHPVEVGNVVETAFVTYFRYGMVCFHQYLGGFFYPEIIQVIPKPVPGTLFEKTAHRRRRHADQLPDLFQRYLLLVVFLYELNNFIDPAALLYVDFAAIL